MTCDAAYLQRGVVLWFCVWSKHGHYLFATAAGDIDTLVVVPRDVKREDFFDTFLDMLVERSKGDNPKVKELHVRTIASHAYRSTALISVCFCGLWRTAFTHPGGVP